MKMGELLAKVKYRFDLGSFPIPYTILAVSLIGASDKLSTIIGVSSKLILLVGIPTGIVVIFGLGWMLDKIKFPHFFQEEANKRNPMLNEIRQGQKPNVALCQPAERDVERKTDSKI